LAEALAQALAEADISPILGIIGDADIGPITTIYPS
jgi:hypothetical protein